MKSNLPVILVQTVVIALILIYLVWGTDVGSLAAAFRSIDWAYVPAALAALFIGVLARAFRLAYLTRDDVAFRQVFHVQNVGYLCNTLLPFRAGEVVMAALFKTFAGARGSRMLSTIGVDRLLDLATVVILFALVVPVSAESSAPAQSLAWKLAAVMAFIVAAVVGILRFRELILRILDRTIRFFPMLDRDVWVERGGLFLDGFSVLRQLPTLVVTTALSALVWLSSALACFLLLAAYSDTLTFLGSVLAITLLVFGTSIVPVPSGIGVIHASITIGLAAYAIPKETGLAVGLSYHALTVALSVILGIMSMSRLNINIESIRRLWRRADTAETR